jgi:hypothetical protein
MSVTIGVAIVAELFYRPYLALRHTYLSFPLYWPLSELSCWPPMAAPAVAAELARVQAAHARQVGRFTGSWLSALVVPYLVALLTPNRFRAVATP